MATAEPSIHIQTREDVLYLLAEAAEIEHNLMCCYLYAVFGLKRDADEGLTPEDLAMVGRWRGAIMGVAIEEMTHLTLVSNLTAALGGRPHLGRQNFPIAAGLHPADIVVRLAPFTMDTLDHFIFLERPEGSDIADSPLFASPLKYTRFVPAHRMMPSGQDYATVGHLYRGIRDGLDHLAAESGEQALFLCPAVHQIGPSVVSLPGLSLIKDLASAHNAIDTVVEQCEGAPEHLETSHFSRFLAVKAEYEAALARNPSFAPSRPVPANPVMRRPVDGRDRVYIDAPLSARVVDLANALYGHMLRLLTQAFGRANPSTADQQVLVDGAIELMGAMAPVAEALTRLPASPSLPGVNAGMTFAMLRSLAPAIEGPGEWLSAGGRVRELAADARELGVDVPALLPVAARLDGLAARLTGHRSAAPSPAAVAVLPAPDPMTAAAPSRIDGDVEIADGKSLTIRFNAKRCIHSRYCVLWQPQVYKANVQGPWIDPDADSLEASIAVAHNCPSGAIQYERRDGGPPESAPKVNLVNVRENGPLAMRAQIVLNGAPIGMRATLCRCGASKNKPFCDGSHNAAGFKASGEPATIDTPALSVRNGPLDITPMPNGPLRVRGNLEICSGTGRTIKKTTGEALCRCGQSGTKPYCDGTHAKVGFVAL